MKILKVLAYIVAALIVLKIIGELLSLLTSFWFIVAAVAVWYFLIRDDSKSTSSTH